MNKENVISFIKQGVLNNKPLIYIYNELIKENKTISKVGFYKTVLSLIEQKQIANILVCYCGHDCSRCRTFHATLNDDEEMRKSIAEYYKTELKDDIPLEKLHCFSFNSDEIMEMCNGCPFMACCKRKGFSSCSLCEEYPCEMLDGYIKAYVNKANQI